MLRIVGEGREKEGGSGVEGVGRKREKEENEKKLDKNAVYLNLLCKLFLWSSTLPYTSV